MLHTDKESCKNYCLDQNYGILVLHRHFANPKHFFLNLDFTRRQTAARHESCSGSA
jgi:hypothetical protein